MPYSGYLFVEKIPAPVMPHRGYLFVEKIPALIMPHRGYLFVEKIPHANHAASRLPICREDPSRQSCRIAATYL
ncbi:hypothetical protein [Mucilaginibacter dorajii]|uniref:hypothetical protein n=1 Tax=Mucilaginibacter dorajii TaxID=692994 RepID=UPI00216998AC|nr:hypothetical protein [Mucilaginibacter dorajii]MCS3735619.1 hypothetical protein [Mucilaginibacter dorajii]